MNPLIWQFEQYEALIFKILCRVSCWIWILSFTQPTKFQDFPTIWLVELTTHLGFRKSFHWIKKTILRADFWDLGGRLGGREKRVCSIIETTFLNSRFLFSENLFGQIIYHKRFPSAKMRLKLALFSATQENVIFDRFILMKT